MNQQTKDLIEKFCKAVSKSDSFPKICGLLQNEGYFSIQDLALLGQDEWDTLGFGKSSFEHFLKFLEEKNIPKLIQISNQKENNDQKEKNNQDQKKKEKKEINQKEKKEINQKEKKEINQKEKKEINQKEKKEINQKENIPPKTNSIQTVTGIENWNVENSPPKEESKPRVRPLETQNISNLCQSCSSKVHSTFYTSYFTSSKAVQCESCYISGKIIKNTSEKDDYIKRVIRDFVMLPEEANQYWSKFVLQETATLRVSSNDILSPYKKPSNFYETVYQSPKETCEICHQKIQADFNLFSSPQSPLCRFCYINQKTTATRKYNFFTIQTITGNETWLKENTLNLVSEFSPKTIQSLLEPEKIEETTTIQNVLESKPKTIQESPQAQSKSKTIKEFSQNISESKSKTIKEFSQNISESKSKTIKEFSQNISESKTIEECPQEVESKPKTRKTKETKSQQVSQENSKETVKKPQEYKNWIIFSAIGILGFAALIYSLRSNFRIWK